MDEWLAGSHKRWGLSYDIFITRSVGTTLKLVYSVLLTKFWVTVDTDWCCAPQYIELQTSSDAVWLKCKIGGSETMWFVGPPTRLRALLQDRGPLNLLQHSVNAK